MKVKLPLKLAILDIGIVAHRKGLSIMRVARPDDGPFVYWADNDQWLSRN